MVAGVLFGVLGAVLVIQGCLTGFRAKASESWPHVEGRVVESRLVEEKDRHSGDMVQRPVITYQYVTETGITNTGNRIAFNPQKIHGPESISLTRRYPTATTVTVYMHPDDHSLSVLKPGPGPSSWFSLKAGLSLIALGLLCVGIYLKKEKPSGSDKSDHPD